MAKRLVGLVIGMVLLLAAVNLPAAASAATYVPGAPPTLCSGAGQAPGQCEELKGVAVDQSNGHVYVIDANSSTSPPANFRISEYDAAGVFVKGFGVGVADGTAVPQVCTVTCVTGTATGVGAVGTGARGIAVDPTTHIVYFVAGAAKVAYYNGTTGAFLGEFTGTEGTASPEAPAKFAGTTGLALDTSNPVQHYLYVATGTGASSVIDKFKVPDPSIPALPAYVCQITGKEVASATECSGTASKDGAFDGISLTSQKGADLAVDAAGNVYIAEEAARNSVSVFDSTGTFVKALTTTTPVAVAIASPGFILVVGNGTLPAGAFEGGLEVEEINVSTGAVVSEIVLPTSTGLGIAVDNSGSSSDGTVYVTEKSGKQLRSFVVALPPEVTDLNPDEGPTAGGNSVVITGDEFTGATAVKFGSNDATSFTVVSDTQITATAPAGALGTVDVIVTTPGGDSPNTPADDYAYVAGPAITNLNPDEGPTAGGNSVVITGDEFTGATAVKFGSNDAASFTVDSDTQITAIAPSGSPGTVDVTVTTAIGTATADYTYVTAPAVTAISPTKGPTAGGTQVTITGTALSDATGVKFGTTSATIGTNSSTQIVVTAPSGVAGTVDVSVTTAGGTSPNTAADDYTYVAAPTILSVTPGKGPTVGGTAVTVTGTNLKDATFKFGTSSATGVSTTPDGSEATMVSPARSAGTVNVIATTSGGTSANTAADDFAYVAAPTVTTSAGATDVTSTSGKVSGTVNPSSDTVTDCHVDYGTSASYGSTAPCSPGSPSGSSPVAVSASLTGLSANTTYHFRVVATNAGGTASGADRTFTTQQAAQPPLPPEPPATCATNPLLCPLPDNKVSLGSAKPQGSSIALKATVPGPGTLVATGKNLVKVTSSAASAGTVTLKLKLTSAGKKQLNKGGKVTVKVTVAYTPSGGSPGTSTKSVTFKAPSTNKK